MGLPKGAVGLALTLDELFNLRVGERLAEVAAVVEDIRGIWNPAMGSTQQGVASQIPENQLADVSWLLFERGFFAAAAESFLSHKQGHFHTSKGLSVNRRAVRHLYDNMRDCAKPHF